MEKNYICKFNVEVLFFILLEDNIIALEDVAYW